MRSSAAREPNARSDLPLVLLAEDDEELRKLLARKLRRRGCDVLEARNGAQLVELVFERAVDPLPDSVIPAALIITDHRMPGRTGLEVLSLLRSVNWATPLIVISAFADQETHAEARRLGVAALFDKPFDLDELTAFACQTVGLDA
ncbi:MAG: response regulator [Kofleriaceae bacterium]